MLATGGVKCWGYNASGEVGDGSSSYRTVPTNVSGLSSGVAAISVGSHHSCALMTNGGVKCWGDNTYGQIGDGTTHNRKTPVDVSGLTSGVIAISAGAYHTCAVLTTGAVKCWGKNNTGQLGDGTTTQRTTPVDVSGLGSGVATVAAGGVAAGPALGEHTCALTTGGGVKCWGDNGSGRLGDGTTTQHLTPVDVSGLTSGAASVTAGEGFSCALTTNGVVKCWGNNNESQLGIGTSGGYSTIPVNTNFGLSNGYSYNNHEVTSLSTGETYSYDANGNMISRTEGGLTYTQVFDAENHLVSVTVSGQTTQFIYDGDGNLVEKIKQDGSKTIYVGGVYEVGKNSGGAVTSTITYYPAGGAMRVNGVLYYILTDRLGSAFVVTDSSGNTVGQMRYYASGDTLLSSGNMLTDRLFTGQRQLSDLGIYQFGARFYSPKLGRFLSADPFIPILFNPQSLNRFSYVLNSPLRYIDPSGHDPWATDPCFYYAETGQCTTTTTVTPTPPPTTTSTSTSTATTTTTTTSGGGSGTGGGGDPSNMTTSAEGVKFIIYWENAGGPPNQYPYVDSGGTCTIGYGHVLYNPGKGCSGWPNQTYRDNPLSLQGAQDFLESDLANFEDLIKRTITADLTQAQFDALVSYTFNSGDQINQPYFKKEIPDLINSGNYDAAAEAIASGPITTGNPPITSDTLKERRQREAYLFLYGVYFP